MASDVELETRRAWTQQLFDEFENINWQYRAGLKRPIIELHDSQKTAGSWHAVSRTMRIAHWLLTDYDWQVVLLVLKHEIVHQYVSEILHVEDEVAHGPAFQRACDRLGLLKPEFRAASGHLPRTVQEKEFTSKGLLGKVEKLFALAESANEHEASLALQKGNELMRRHNLERLGTLSDSKYDTVIINTGKKRIDGYQRYLCTILSDYYFVNVTTSRIYNQRKFEFHRSIELSGERSNLAIAEYVYSFIEKKLLLLWKEHRHKNGVAGRERRSFYLGVLHGFKEKLAKEEKAALARSGGESSSLIHLADPGLERYYGCRYPRLRRMKHPEPRVYQKSYDSGKNEGARMTIHKSMEHAAGNLSKLIGE